MTEMMRCAIYARVSTDEQTTDNQMPVLQDMVLRRGWSLAKVYQEDASAWKAGRQRALAEMLKDASTHSFDVVLVWALDRLTREGIATILQYVNTLKRHNVRVISVQESWTEFPNEMSELFFAITAWAAKFDSDRKSARVKAALERRRAKGLPIGRAKGAKDSKPRKRTGYLLRFAGRRE